MKKALLPAAAFTAMALLFAGINRMPVTSKGFRVGTPEIRSISALTFAPNGTLFIGDSKSASVYAVDIRDAKAAKASAYTLSGIDQQIAAALGTTKENITITDMAVNPVSKKLYFSVQTADGSPVVLRLEGGTLTAVALKEVPFAVTALNNVAAEDAKDQRGRSLRLNTISDMGFSDGKLMVSGLSNKEFSSSFRTIPFPFTGKQDEASLELYHTSHGRYETTSPIRTFTTTTIAGKSYLVAAYTCTPLVLFPMDELKAGSHVKGRTVAEMGNQNTPMDMIVLHEKSGSSLVMANTNRPAAKVDHKSLEAFQGTLTARIPGTGGVAFKQLPFDKVVRLAKLDDSRAVVLQKKSDGTLDLWTSDGQNL